MAALPELAVVAPLLAMAVACSISVIAYRRRHKPGALLLAGIMASIAVWNGARLIAVSVAAPRLSLAATNAEYLGAAMTTVLVFAFVLEFTGREHLLTGRTLAVLLLEPIALVVVMATNDLHQLYWTNVRPATDPAATTSFAAEHGSLWTVHIVVVLLLLGGSIAMLVEKAIRTRSLHRSQSVAVIVAIVVSTVGTFVQILTDLGWTMPFGHVLMGVALSIAVFDFKLVDLTPVARATVMEELGAGILVLDDDDVVTDCNPRARELFDIPDERSAIGTHASDVFYDQALWERYTDRTDLEEELTVDTDRGRFTFSVNISPIRNRRNRLVGRVFLVQDVTERKRRERELERMNDQLAGMASVISHDLRNPLQVASGHAELIDDDHAVKVRTSLDRMDAIIDDVLSLATDGNQIESLTPTALPAVATAAWEQVGTLNATLTVETDRNVLADGTRLQRLFENLFRNAMEHGREDETTPLSITVGPIEARTELATGPIGFFVADDGRGMTAEARENAFTAGFTGDGSGTGLGLSIVERIAAAHGWSVELRESEAGGVRFEFTGVELADGPTEQ